MPSQKRSRLRRKQLNAARQRKLTLPPSLRDRLDVVKQERDKKLRDISTDYRGRTEKLLEAEAKERREVWDEFNERRETILQADALSRQRAAEQLLAETGS